MAQQVSSVDALWEQWQQLVSLRQEVGERMVAKGDQWKAAQESGDMERAVRLWSEREELVCEHEIAEARANVVLARHVVAKYDLDEAEVFG